MSEVYPVAAEWKEAASIDEAARTEIYTASLSQPHAFGLDQAKRPEGVKRPELGG